MFNKKAINILFWGILLCLNSQAQQVADVNFNFPVKKPVYQKGKGTVITLDQAHLNFHTLSEKYFAFGKVLENDGYVLKPGTELFTAEYLSNLKILVIANALGDAEEEKLPTKSAFSANEIKEVEKWVSDGGSLFLIADHMPFSGAAAKLSLAFGFNFIDGFALRTDKKDEFFSREAGTLTSNIITNGRNKSERIDTLLFFTGQGFIVPKNATIISRLNSEYDVLLPAVAWEFKETTPIISGQGLANGAFMKYGKGRLVIMGEAAMFSAQLAGPQQRKVGMNNPNAKQNPQFLLNIIHWLDKKL